MRSFSYLFGGLTPVKHLQINYILPQQAVQSTLACSLSVTKRNKRFLSCDEDCHFVAATCALPTATEYYVQPDGSNAIQSWRGFFLYFNDFFAVLSG